jgi:AcrR family transcriptional regulator
MARHKSISDGDLLDRLMAAIQTHGPDGLSFARAGAAVGLSAATMVQRFGNHPAMIEAILLRAWDSLDAATRAADQSAEAGPEGAIALLCSLMPAGSPETDLTDGLLLLREDFRNPTLRARGKAWGEALAIALGRRLNPDPALGTGLGWQMLQVWQGALIWWAFTRTGSASAHVEAALRDWCRTARVL